MTQLTATDLQNAKLDVDTIAGIANSTANTVTDRLGASRRTIYSLQNEYPNASDNAAAALVSATTASNAQTAAELARDAANATGKVYASTTAGISDTTSGQYFNVVSAGANDYLDLYLNNAGVAVYQKTYPSTAYLRNSVGKLNFWPDPFFRRFDLTSETFLGRDRWWTSVSGSVFTGWYRDWETAKIGRAHV